MKIRCFSASHRLVPVKSITFNLAIQVGQAPAKPRFARQFTGLSDWTGMVGPSLLEPDFFAVLRAKS